MGVKGVLRAPPPTGCSDRSSLFSAAPLTMPCGRSPLPPAPQRLMLPALQPAARSTPFTPMHFLLCSRPGAASHADPSLPQHILFIIHTKRQGFNYLFSVFFQSCFSWIFSGTASRHIFPEPLPGAFSRTISPNHLPGTFSLCILSEHFPAYFPECFSGFLTSYRRSCS